MSNGIEKLIELMIIHGGKIVSSASLDAEQIRQAQASGRMFVDENGYGIVWEPCIMRMPETDEDVEFFEKWYPLDVEMPEKFLTADFLFECGGAKCKIPNCKICKNQMY